MNTEQLVTHEAQQNDIKGQSGDAPYEVRLEQRILKHIAQYPGITVKSLRHRLGVLVTDAQLESTLNHMVSRGVIKLELETLQHLIVE
jgi:hypothetical protein